MTISRKNHYIPRMYLKNWAVTDKIFVYRLLVSNEKVPLWEQKSVSHTGLLNNLYTDIQDNIEFDRLEHIFDARFESPSKDAFDKICNNQKMTSSDWTRISDYIVAQYIRTPSFYFYISEWGKQYYPDALEKLSQHLTELKEIPISTFELTPDDFMLPINIQITDKHPDDNYALLEISATIGKQLWFFAMNSLLRSSSPLLNFYRNLKWSIITIYSGMNFPTCDNPVVLCGIENDKLYQLPVSNGLTGKNKAILFPISPSIALLGMSSRKFKWHFQANKGFSKMLCKAILDNALMYIYNNTEDPEIPKIRPRLIDLQEYKRIEREFGTWFEKYLSEEAPLLHRTNNQNC